jgi:uncharacterized repeat protein (TIGR02543 family)
MGDQTATYDGSLTLQANTFALTGYNFSGWNTDPAGTSGTSYANSQSISQWKIASNLTLYAQWTPKTNITLAFDANGGTGAPADKTVVYGSAVGALPEAGSGAPTRAGYVFQGWSKSSGATTPDFTSAYIVDFDPALTVYAVWAPDTRTITYHSSGHTSGAVPVQTTHTRGDTVTVSDKGTLARTHYSFQGWSTNASANTVTHAEGASLTVDSDTNLYAVWKEDAKYTVTYSANGGTGAPSDKGAYYGGDTVTVKAPGGIARSGYSFRGWADTKDGSAKYSAGDTFKITNNTTLYAVWQQDEQPAEPAAPVTPTPPAPPAGTGTEPGAATPATDSTAYPGADGTTDTGSTQTGTSDTDTDNQAANGNGNAGADNSATNSPGANNAASSPLALLSGDGEIVSQDELRELAREAGVPLVGIGENAIPLVGIEGYAFWSLVDLAIILFSIVLAIWHLFYFRRRRDQEGLSASGFALESENGLYTPKSGNSNGIGNINGNVSGNPGRTLFILIFVITIANAALFLLSQDFTATPLVMVDIWSIPTVALFAAECILARILSKRTTSSAGAREEASISNA